jgi:hypothetical protein
MFFLIHFDLEVTLQWSIQTQHSCLACDSIKCLLCVAHWKILEIGWHSREDEVLSLLDLLLYDFSQHVLQVQLEYSKQLTPRRTNEVCQERCVGGRRDVWEKKRRGEGKETNLVFVDSLCLLLRDHSNHRPFADILRRHYCHDAQHTATDITQRERERKRVRQDKTRDGVRYHQLK